MKWEYAHCKTPVDTPDLLAFLNSMGRDGWELVADLSEYDALWYFIFKRPVKEVEKGRPLQLGEGAYVTSPRITRVLDQAREDVAEAYRKQTRGDAP